MQPSSVGDASVVYYKLQMKLPYIISTDISYSHTAILDKLTNSGILHPM